MRLTLALALLIATACTNASSAPWQTEDQLKAVDGETWVVGTHLVTVSPDAAAQLPKPPLGSTIRVSGVRTPRGELIIDTVEVLNAPAAQPTPPTRPPARVQPTPARAPAKKPHRGEDD